MKFDEALAAIQVVYALRGYRAARDLLHSWAFRGARYRRWRRGYGSGLVRIASVRARWWWALHDAFDAHVWSDSAPVPA